MKAVELTEREFALGRLVFALLERAAGVKCESADDVERMLANTSARWREADLCGCGNCRKAVAVLAGAVGDYLPGAAGADMRRLFPGGPASVAEVAERLAPAGTVETILASMVLSFLSSQGMPATSLADARRAGAIMAGKFLQRNAVANPATAPELVRELRRRIGEAQPVGAPPAGPGTEAELLLAEVVLRTLAREGVTHNTEQEVAASAYGVAALAPTMVTTDRQRQFVKHLGTALAAARKAGGK